MTFLELVLIALVEGVAEVLPLSAAGHLALFPPIGGGAERLAVALATHLGILVALLLYFWRDLLAMAMGVVKLVKGRSDAGARLLLSVLLGTVPALALAWLLTRTGFSPGGPVLAGSALLVFGLFLLVADRLGMTVRRVEHMSHLGAFAIGMLQAAALIPGVSRTGITVTAARLMGYERREAARFSLLLAIPATAALFLHSAWRLAHGDGLRMSSDMVTAAGLSCAAALIATAGLMAWLREGTFTPFALWRIAVGAGALAWLAWD